MNLTEYIVSYYNRRFSNFPAVNLRKIIEMFKTPNMVVVEVGVFEGATTTCYADIVKSLNGHIYVIDWFKGSELVNSFDENYLLNKFKKNTEDYQDSITILKGKSHEMLSTLPDQFADLIFIDADHRYEFVYNDIQIAKQKIKPGGILCGHDCENIAFANNFPKEWLNEDCVENDSYGVVHYGVVQAVYDHFQNNVLIVEDGATKSNIWIKKYE